MLEKCIGFENTILGHNKNVSVIYGNTKYEKWENESHGCLCLRSYHTEILVS